MSEKTMGEKPPLIEPVNNSSGHLLHELEVDLVRNKRARRKLALLNSIQESRLESLTLLQDVVEKINTIDDIPRLFQEIGGMLQRVLNHEVSAIYLQQTGIVYFNSRFQLSESSCDRIAWHLIEKFEENNEELGAEEPKFHDTMGKQSRKYPLTRESELKPVFLKTVTAREECIGSIGIFTTQDYPMSLEQDSHFNEIIRNASMLIDNAVLYDKMFRANRNLENKIGSLHRLLDISRALSSTMSYEELIDYILTAAMREANADGGSLMLVDERRKELTLEAIKGLSDDMKESFKLKLGDGIAGLVAEEQEPWILLDVSYLSEEMERQYSKYTLKFFPFEKYEERGGVCSAICIPLMSKQGVIGVLNLTSSTKLFTEEDLDLVLLFGSLATNAIENSRMLFMEEKRIKELVKFSDIGKLLSSTFEQAEIIDLVINALSDILKFNVALFLVEESNRFLLTVVSSCNIGLSVVEKLKSTIVETFERYSGCQVDEDDIEIALKKIGNLQVEISNERFGSIIDAPLAIKGQSCGMISLLAFEEEFFDEDSERTLSTFASTVAVALDNSSSYEKMERSVREVSMLFEVSKTMTSTLDVDTALNMIVSISAELMDARVAFLRLPNKDGLLEVNAGYGDFDRELGELSIPVGEGITGRAYEQMKPIVINQIASTDLLGNKDQLLSHGLNSCIAVPLTFKDKPIGVITCFFDEVKKFADSDINLLSALASHAAIVFQNARLYEEMNENYTNTIMALSAAIDAKDHYTHGHSRNVMEYAVAIAGELGLSKEEVETIKFAGLLHDIGKIGIPESILRKPTGLTDEEFAIISSHPKLGAAIMNQVKFLQKISPLAYHHHERYDGKGYPDGLAGDAIPLGARILNISDSFDVMTTSRVYRKALSFEEAVAEVKRCSGEQFDPDVANAFLKVIDKVYNQVKEGGPNSVVELVRKSYESLL